MTTINIKKIGRKEDITPPISLIQTSLLPGTTAAIQPEKGFTTISPTAIVSIESVPPEKGFTMIAELVGWTMAIQLEEALSSRFSFRIEETLSRLHMYWVTIPNPDEVRDYLTRYPDLTDILPFVCKTARERLGTDSQLSLEVYHDPEIEYEYLTLYIRQETYDENIDDIIDDIDEQYLSYLIGTSGWLLVTTDFQPPKA